MDYGIRYVQYASRGGGTPVYRIKENQEVGNMWGLIFKGISEDGSWVFEDKNHDGQTDNNDRTYIGNGMPNLELGFGNNLRYARWDLNLFFKGAFGHDIANMYRASYEIPGLSRYRNIPVSSLALKNANGTYGEYGGPFSDLYVEKGNYFKLANINLGYNLKFQDQSQIQSLRLYFTGNNLFVLTNYKGSDPEIRYGNYYRYNDYGYNPLTPGYDNVEGWLMTRSFALGISMTF